MKSIITSIIFLFLLTSCEYLFIGRYISHPSMPFEEIKSVAVVPFYVPELKDDKDNILDPVTVGDIFASELVQTSSHGFKVQRPEQVAKFMLRNKIKLQTSADAIELAKLLEVDAIIVGAITEYNPYFPPRVAMAVEMFTTKQHRFVSIDIDKVIMSGKAEPLPISDSSKHLFTAYVENVYDSSNQLTRLKVKAYSRTHKESDWPGEDETHILRSMRLYLRYVSFETASALFDEARYQQRKMKDER